MYRVHSQNPQVEPPPPGRGNMPEEEPKLLQEQCQKQNRQDSRNEEEPELILDHWGTNSKTAHQAHTTLPLSCSQQFCSSPKNWTACLKLVSEMLTTSFMCNTNQTIRNIPKQPKYSFVDKNFHLINNSNTS